MNFKLYGRKNKKTIILIHPECARWNIFDDVVPVLSKEYRIIIPVLPGYDPERPHLVFSSVEKCASIIEKWLVSYGFTLCDCIYGCSLGGAIAARIAADRKIKIDHLIIDGTSAPNTKPKAAAEAAVFKEWLKVKSDKKINLRGMNPESVKRSLFCAGNYDLRPGKVRINASVQYWYCRGNADRSDIAFMKKVFPNIEIVENPGSGKAGFLRRYPDDFCGLLSDFTNSKNGYGHINRSRTAETYTTCNKLKSRSETYRKKHGARRQELRRKKMLARNFFIPPVVFSLMFFFLECMLRILNDNISFFGAGLIRCFISSVATGTLLWLLTSIISNKTVSAAIAACFMGIVAFFVCIEAGLMFFFGTYYRVSYIFSMSSQVAGNFSGEIRQLFFGHFQAVILAAVPCLTVIIFRKVLFPETAVLRRIRIWIFQTAVFVLSFILNVVVCLAGDSAYYTTEFSPNTAIVKFGILNSLRLELKYSIFGMPSVELKADETYVNTEEENEVSETTDTKEEIEEKPVDIEYGDNVLDIDFNSLISSDTDDTLLAMDEYFSSQTPTEKNEYTGLFEGKNLIMITAEAFSYAVIDKDRTPALYELANNGFVLTNYYQPDWTQSTTGGEFSQMTGIIPTWIGGKTSFTKSVGDAMPFALGWIFKSEGYSSKAYHNSTYSYYGRDETHTNLGYDYMGIGNGLEIESASHGWPASDLEMIEATIGENIEAYVNDKTPFHIYYMSVSGHGEYGWDDNSMSKKNEEYIESLNLAYSEPILAYLAAQQELEYALEYLLSELDKAGIADDTVIVMTADHYPYYLTMEDVDYYPELIGNYDTNVNMTEYHKNTLILWSGCIEDPIEVDVPCTAIDAVPTILNLFGIDYDSRLLSGRDVLAPDVEVGNVDSNMHIAMFANSGFGRSWVTNAGTYEAYTKTFTPAEGVELEDEEAYINAIAVLLENKFTYAQYIISENYYAHVFPNWTGGMKLTDALAASSLG